MESRIPSLLLVFTYGLSMVLFGSTIACIPCCARRLPRPFACSSITVVGLSWGLASILWFAFSPLSVCSPRVVYSYPRHSYYGEAYWCSKACNARIIRPVTEGDIRTALESASSVRLLGAGHSPTELQCTDSNGILLSTENLCHFGGIDAENVATFGSGCRVSWAQEQLLARGYQLHGFGGIVSQRLGGAVSTSLHGQHTTPFANHLVGLSAILANGSKIHLDRTDEHFMAWPGSMGMLGAITVVQLKVWKVQMIECATTAGDRADLEQAMLNATLVGFEARRLLDGGSDDEYTIRRCIESDVNSSTTVPFESKDDLVSGFLIDNVALGLMVLLGGGIVRLPGFTETLFSLSEVGSSRQGVVASVNDYRVRVSYNPHFDEEYAVPMHSCHAALNDIGQLLDLPIHSYIRRIDHGLGWLSWSPQPSCTIRLEYFDFGRTDMTKYEDRFRRGVEHIVLSHGGAGHFGKPWYSNASLLLNNSPNRTKFFRYRAQLDPLQLFQNDYTREMWTADQRKNPVLPEELDVRAMVWRTAIWTSIAASVVAGALACGSLWTPSSRAKTDPTEVIVKVQPLPRGQVRAGERRAHMRRL